MRSLQRAKSRREAQQKPETVHRSDAISLHSHMSHHYPIYQSPTVETLDGSLVSERLAYSSSQNNARQIEMGATPLVKNSATRPLANLIQAPPRVSPRVPSHPRRRPPQTPQRLESRPRREKRRSQPRDFQIPEDMARVEIRIINVAERSAFTPIRPPSVEEWKQVAQHAEQTRRVSMKKRLSPSLQHLELLHKMQNVRTIRQLSFSPGLSLDADPWNEDLEGGKNINRRPSRTNRRDGRYRPIHPIKATMAVLPETPPVLSHRKYRLPCVSDVGFPNPSQDELERKQNEIRLETQWEEASPRLIVLITSDDFGTSVLEGESEPIPALQQWNQGGWNGLPLAGRELIMAKERNYDVFGKAPSQPKRKWKANPRSMLAPPLGSTYSSGQDWKPRPFYDRPPGFTYALACPTKIEFDVGNVEPLICSLTLYTLPPDGTKRKGQVYGKTSEDFYLPAGDWYGKVDIMAARKSDGGIDQSVIDSWHHKKHKGLFSYDPKSAEKQSLYIVLQIFQLSHRVGAEVYLEVTSKEATNRSPELTKKRSIGRRIKSKLGKMAKSSSTEKCDLSDFDLSTVQSESTYEECGTKLLTPLGFGIVPLFSNDGETVSQWPEGSVQVMPLFSFPAHSETEDQFLDRLIYNANAPSSNQGGDSEECPISKMDMAENATPSKRRIFTSSRALKTASMKEMRKVDDALKTARIAGSATLFSSALGVDFTQAILSEPTAIMGDDDANKRSRVSRLLVDISGDCAIALNPQQLDHSSTTSGAGSEISRSKRSNLIRLPNASIPAGYADNSEVRELQYLPPRPQKQYDFDSPTSFQSTTNLIYIYPRFLKLSTGTDGQITAKQLYVIRIRLVKTTVQTDDASGLVEPNHQALESFHNPAPWAGPRMLTEVYTKPGKSDVGSHGKEVASMRDEFKLRLPVIIDGTYFLEFKLLRTSLSNSDGEGGVRMDSVSETIIPLSSSSNREASSGVRITTIIPNGSHRLKLGEHQLQFETRLVSSIHIGDPTAATTLRDFPFTEDQNEDRDLPDKFKELALVPSRSIVGKLLTAEPVVDIKVPFHQLFANASESALMGQFPLLMHMHLSNLINRLRYDFSLPEVLHRFEDGDNVSVMTGKKGEGQFIVENMCSLFEITRKVKQNLSKREEGSVRDHFELFAKEFVDRFDERIFSGNSQNGTDGDEISLDPANSSLMERSRSAQSNLDIRQATSASQAEDLEEDPGDDFTDGGAVRLRTKVSSRSDFDLRISKTISVMSAKATPFSRVAYGATKTDRMRIEAEINQEGPKFTRLTDDDETVISSFYANKEQMSGEGNMDIPRIEDSNTWGASDEETLIDEKRLIGETSGYGKTSRSDGFGEFSFAKRVRTVAQVMIAPCIAPSLSTTLAQGARRDGGDQPLPRRAAKAKELRKQKDNKSMKLWVQPGSDTDDEEVITKKPKEAQSVVFRGQDRCHYVTLTIGDLDEVEDKSGAWARKLSFVYEAIFALWAKTWLDYTAENGKRIQPGWYHRSGQETENRSLLVESFHANIGILLPLCLKSLAMRCLSKVPDSSPRSHVIVDEYHMNMFESVTEMLCLGLMAEAMSGADNPDQAIANALGSTDTVVDFLIGLSPIIHPQQHEVIVTKFFRTLRLAEIDDEISVGGFEWNADSIRRVKSSRHLRLRAIEKLSVLSSFVQSNFPLKFSGWNPLDKETSVSWNVQKAGGPEPHGNTSTGNSYGDDAERLPRSGWLACQLADETLLICSLSCEAVVAEAMALAEITQHHMGGSPTSRQSALQQRPGKSLKRSDLLLFQSMAVHSITCLHELLLRRHAMDSRYQSDQCQGRVAAMFAPSILTKSIDNVRWLARMESTHKVRSLWLLCFVYILQEAPEALLRARLRSYCYPPDFSIHRFIRLLRLSSSTFQCLVGDVEETLESDAGSSMKLSSWLLQESFNTICATATLLVDECTIPISSYPREQKKMAQGILDLLLHILTIPQSAVTHLRSVGAALHSLTKFGAAVFFDVVGDSLQHWIRVILTLMNSVSLSVRSISVDFVISLLGETFKDNGNIDDITTMIATVLPEVIAREIALFSVSGLITETDQIENAVWPLRRAFADVEEADPDDDDRVDSQLSPILSILCRSCQAIMDGVLIELRLKGNNLTLVGTRLGSSRKSSSYIFDADEESLFEAASFFPSETAPMQKLRWLQTLKLLHESKGQWVEAAETLMLCAKTISDSIPHLRNGWRPSEFILWHDDRRSLWLGTIGKDIGLPDRGNVQVMEFASVFLEPSNLFGESSKKTVGRKLAQPTVSAMCTMLTKVTKEAVSKYLNEDGMDELAFSRLEALLRVVISVVEDHSVQSTDRSIMMGIASRQRMAEESALLRRVSASLNSDLTRLAERLALVTQDDGDGPTDAGPRQVAQHLAKSAACRQYYVRVVFSGIKPQRFTERTTIPTCFDWDSPCISRVPQAIITNAVASQKNGEKLEVKICNAFAQPLLNVLGESVVFRNTEIVGDPNESIGSTFLDISLVHMDIATMNRDAARGGLLESKRFFCRKPDASFQLNNSSELPQFLRGVATNLIEFTVANPFPCPLSRQRTLITSEFTEETA